MSILQRGTAASFVEQAEAWGRNLENREAIRRGVSTTGFAIVLFEAVYAARAMPGGTGDSDLDAAVARSVILFANGLDTAAIAPAVGLSEPTVVKILDAWRREIKGALQ